METTLTKINETETRMIIIIDDLLYKCRFVMARTNACLDAFKVILIRFETNQIHVKHLI